jgi:hypothetical protein
MPRFTPSQARLVNALGNRIASLVGYARLIVILYRSISIYYCVLIFCKLFEWQHEDACGRGACQPILTKVYLGQAHSRGN